MRPNYEMADDQLNLVQWTNGREWNRNQADENEEETDLLLKNQPMKEETNWKASSNSLNDCVYS